MLLWKKLNYERAIDDHLVLSKHYYKNWINKESIKSKIIRYQTLTSNFTSEQLDSMQYQDFYLRQDEEI